MTKIDDEILNYLQAASRRDVEKGGAGWRSTSEITECLRGIRGDRRPIFRRLNILHEANRIEAAGPVDIGGYLWRVPMVPEPTTPGSADR